MNTGLERCAGMPVVPAHITAALNELDDERAAAGRMPTATAGERAARSARIALVEARAAAWFGVLAEWTYLSGVPAVGRVVLAARSGKRDSARDWRDSAIYWRDRTPADAAAPDEAERWGDDW